MSDTILGWWFGDDSGVLPHGDGRKIIIGETHTVDAEHVEPCVYGLHASPTVLDALQYATGPYLYRVRLSGVIIPHGNPVDKYAASERTYLDGDDATPLLRWFARACAAGVLHMWDAPQVVKDYLRTGDESLRAAAWDAAWDAAGAAARAAAWAAWAARYARDAAGAAWAAWAAAWETQRKWLEAGALQWFGIEPHALDDLIAKTRTKR